MVLHTHQVLITLHRIDFMAEFKAVTSADDLDQLRRKLKKEDYQPNGDSFLPDMVYNCIRKLSAFATVWVSKAYVPSEVYSEDD